MNDIPDGGEARPPRWFGEAIGVHRELAALGVKVGALHENKMGKDQIADINKNIQGAKDAAYVASVQFLEGAIINLEKRLEANAAKAANDAADRVAQDFSQQTNSRRGWHPVVHQVGGGSIVGGILAILYMLGAIPGG